VLSAPGAGSFVANATATPAAYSAASKKRHGAVRISYGTGTATSTGAGPVNLSLRPSKAARSLLRQGKELTVRVAITFTPVGGTPSGQSTTVTVRPKHKRHR
jgi:hypothetical protein